MHVFRMAFPWNNQGIPKIGYMLTCLGLSSQGYAALRLRAHTQGDERAKSTRRPTRALHSHVLPNGTVLSGPPTPPRKCSLQRGCSQWGVGSIGRVKRRRWETFICFRWSVKIGWASSPCHYRITLTAAAAPTRPSIDTVPNLLPPSYWFSHPETACSQRAVNYRVFYRELHLHRKLYQDTGVIHSVSGHRRAAREPFRGFVCLGFFFHKHWTKNKFYGLSSDI